MHSHKAAGRCGYAARAFVGRWVRCGSERGRGRYAALEMAYGSGGEIEIDHRRAVEAHCAGKAGGSVAVVENPGQGVGGSQKQVGHLEVFEYVGAHVGEIGHHIRWEARHIDYESLAAAHVVNEVGKLLAHPRAQCERRAENHHVVGVNARPHGVEAVLGIAVVVYGFALAGGETHGRRGCAPVGVAVDGHGVYSGPGEIGHNQVAEVVACGLAHECG